MISKEIFAMQAQICQAMGNPARLEIVHLLRDGPQPVNNLAHSMGLSQNTLSRHLAVLRQTGLVTTHHQKRERLYQLTNPKLVVICDLMRQVLSEQLTHQAEMTDILENRA